MIYKDGKETTAVYVGTMAVQYIYQGAKLVWQAVSKIWIGKQVWRGKDIW